MHAKGNLLYWSKPLCVEIVHIPLIPDPASTASIFSFVRPSLVNTFSFARDDISCMSSIRGKGYFSRFATRLADNTAEYCHMHLLWLYGNHVTGEALICLLPPIARRMLGLRNNGLA